MASVSEYQVLELEELLAVAQRAGAEADIRAALLTGAGDVFVSGADLNELREASSPEDAARFSELGVALALAYSRLPYPVLCAMEGPAIGGGAELACMCDLRICDARATFSFKHVRMGTTTAWGTTARLASLVGPARAARLLYTAHEIGADEALTMGLVDAKAEWDRMALDLAVAWGHDIALGSPTAVAVIKRNLVANVATDESIAFFERSAFVSTWAKEDRKEAVEAYFARRPPAWKPRA